MEFGRDVAALNEMDFTLRASSVETLKMLTYSNNLSVFKAYVGGTKWADKKLVGKIYPKGTPPSAFLNLYAKNFNTIEFGPTFYMAQPLDKLAAWTFQVEANDDFKFSPKFTKTISHLRRLMDVDELTNAFYDSIRGFGNHLGQSLLQMSESFSPKSFNQLERYLNTLRPAEQVSVELRHQDWFSDAANRQSLFNLLRKSNVGTVISDTAGRRDAVHMELTTPIAYIRFVGNGLHPTDYSRIDSWVARLNEWKAIGLNTLWFYIHQQDERDAVELADYLICKMNSDLKTTLQRPTIISRSEY